VAAVLAAVATWAFDAVWIAGGSMEPTLSRGDLVIAASWEPVGAGDVVLFEDGGALVVHRVVRVLPTGDVITRGDANPVADLEPVAVEAIRGRVVARLRL
jgi:signal peptidase